ncbi:hypothetical protein Tco_1368185 [Tanacetum coccineum]
MAPEVRPQVTPRGTNPPHQSTDLLPPIRSPVAQLQAMITRGGHCLCIGKHVLRPEMGDDNPYLHGKQVGTEGVVDLTNGLRGWKRVSHIVTARGESVEFATLYLMGH